MNENGKLYAYKKQLASEFEEHNDVSNSAYGYNRKVLN